MEESLSKAKEYFQEQLGKFLVWSIDVSPTPIETIYNTAKNMNVFVWRSLAVSQSSGTGVICALPILNWTVGIGADIFSLLYMMAVTSYGVGAIIAHRNGLSYTVLNKSDYLDVLAVWCDATEYIQDIQVKSILLGGVAAKKAGFKIGTKAVTKGSVIGASYLSSKAGIKIPTKLLDKAATKAVTKLGAKAGAMLTGIGALVSGGINFWFVNSITNAAKVYYTAKFEDKKISL
ncbi:hypothetical protein Riv7116_6926 (plasmid) [Rivularia sp. PCC 7116]|uniref:hypothetical protein n=1 Tax=Rivularia sp. PCC 7116 TaxID=373994 RepID=UPI00029EFCD2|nr:hypothetical protein [Rivularia sp. PCC 7116]AFY59238.1 hypothetical protein Riv7116_6926 [Rivularia sp. PCC 7116]